MSDLMVLDLRMDIAAERLDKLIDAMGGSGKGKAMQTVAEAMGRESQRHLLRIATRRHKTADRLDARRTNTLQQSAADVSVGSSADTAVVEIPGDGLRRAFRPLTIRPREARALTIPIHALAYGKRARDVARERVTFIPKGTNVIVTKDDKGNLIPLYALVMQAIIPQDRELLPSDDEYAATAKSAYVSAISSLRGA